MKCPICESELIKREDNHLPNGVVSVYTCSNQECSLDNLELNLKRGKDE